MTKYKKTSMCCIEIPKPSWLSYHIFYSSKRWELLLEVILPLLAGLCQKGALEKFFFIQYPERGIHVRLRLLPVLGYQQFVSARVSSVLDVVPDEFPVNMPGLAEGKPGCGGAAVFAVPFEPEVERYGGDELLVHSLDFFCISSVESLNFCVSHHRDPKARQLGHMALLLARQALGFSDSVDEFLGLISYMSYFSHAEFSAIVLRGDQVFDCIRSEICLLLSEEIRSAIRSLPPSVEFSPKTAYLQASRCLSMEIRAAEASVRQRIGSSQMHMTANRIGLSNQDEIYLGRILWRAASVLLESDTLLRDELHDMYNGLGKASKGAVARLSDLRRFYLDKLQQR